MRRIISVSIASGVVALAAIAVRSHWPREIDPIRRLAEVAASTRDVEARLTGGFPWAPLRAAKRGEELSDDRLILAAAVGETLLTAPQDRHAAGIGKLLLGKPRAAVAALEAITEPNAGTWSDLAAARYAVAAVDDDPEQLVRALAAADAALRLDAALPEARFNRALIVERLGVRDQARAQWEAYLAVDGGSPWAVEARQHLRNLQPVALFKDELEPAYDRVASDPAAAHSLTARYRRDARVWGETEILARWATAERDGDKAVAAKHLALAREIGAALARDRGEAMLRELVAAIERADASQRRALVTAHLDFREGVHTYSADRPADAEKILLRAAEAFEHGGSPGSLLARYFAANTAFSQGRIEESRQRLKRLLAASPAEFVAHRAQVLWQIGADEFALAHWGDAIDALSESVAIFERLDERIYAGTVRAILGTTYERIGNPAAAWKHRLIALRDLGQRPGARLETIVSLIGRHLALKDDWASATSLFGIAVEIAHSIDDPLVEIETLTHRARANIRMSDRAAANVDLQEARALLQRVREAGYRELLESQVIAAEALATSDPAAAVPLLTRAIEFHRTKGRRMNLPELLMERGRARRMMSDDVRAAADFEAAVAELESRRETLDAGEDRWGFFHDADELFSAAIDLSLENQSPARAFQYAERARARALLDTLGVSWPAVKTSDVPQNTAILEFVIQPARTIIFVVDQTGIRATEHVVDRNALLREIAALTGAAIGADDRRLRQAGRSLHAHLIEPVETQLQGKGRLVIVPDPRMGVVPFAAFVNGEGRFLFEDFALSISPGAAILSRLRETLSSAADKHVLIVAGSEQLGRLAAAEREVAAVASIYARSTRLTRNSATRAEFAKEAAGADVLHFTGHAVASQDASGSLLLEDGELRSREIAAMRLNRTSLVVLAACGTAAGEIRSTEGTISVARAFLAAGAPSVVATLWPVEDEEAAQFFPLIHRNIASGLSPAEALRAAQLEWFRKPGSHHIWTAVQVVGR